MRLRQTLGILSDENGAVLITTLLVLTVLSIIIFSLNDTSNVERRIAMNDRDYKIAFNNADTGISVGLNVVEAVFVENFDGTSMPSVGFTYYKEDGTLADTEEAVLAAFQKLILPPAGSKASVGFSVYGNHDVRVEISFNDRTHLPGTEKGFAFFYDMESEGEAADSARSAVEARYRHIERF